MMFKKIILGAFLLMGIGLTQVVFSQSDIDGEALFKTNCSSCHRVVGKLIGPQMKGLQAKYADDKEWMYEWVRNSQKLIADGDPKAVALWEANNKQIMNAFPSLSNEEIDAIMAYAEAPPVSEVANKKPGDQAQNQVISKTGLYSLMIMVGFLLIVVLGLSFITLQLVRSINTGGTE